MVVNHYDLLYSLRVFPHDNYKKFPSTILIYGIIYKFSTHQIKGVTLMDHFISIVLITS